MKAPLHQTACFLLEGVFLPIRMQWRIARRIAAAARGVALMFGVALAAGSALAQQAPWRVVILNDADPTLPAFVAIDRGIRSALAAPGLHRVDVFAESLDMMRYPEALFEREMVDLLAKKYGARPIDAVVTTGVAALDFAEKHRDRLWPQARIVFMGVPPEVLHSRKLGPNTTGMPRQLDFGGVVDLALRLRPETRRLVVVSGSGDLDRRVAQVAREQIARHAQRLAIEHWEGQTLAELLRRLGRLGRDDAVLYVMISRDAEGRIYAPMSLVKSIAEATPAPVYGSFETFVGQGIVAGMVYPFEERGQRMGELVHEVLASRPAPPPPPRLSGLPTCVADARGIERHGMDADRLPPGCDVRFLAPSLWREYRWWVVGALLVMLVQAALIVGLVMQRRGRRVAEAEARKRRAELGQASRLALAGELTASIAHEINQPLGAILANAGAAEALLRRDPGANAELREILADIRKSDLRASEIIHRVRALVTTRQAEHERVDANVLVDDVLAFLRGEARRRGVAVETALAPGLPMLVADRVQLQQALVNLCVNAMEAMDGCEPNRRKLEVRTVAVDRGVEIAVRDSGPGIANAQLPQLFDSFFTTKQNGTGLGLSITRSIVEAHGGRIVADNRAEGGASFRITLPLQASAMA
jgi:signal transduction histidine kinase